MGPTLEMSSFNEFFQQIFTNDLARRVQSTFDRKQLWDGLCPYRVREKHRTRDHVHVYVILP